MHVLKNFLDRISNKTPPPEVQEAEKLNRIFDTRKLDESISRAQRVSDEFADAISQVIKDLNSERKDRRGYEKTHSRARKT